LSVDDAEATRGTGVDVDAEDDFDLESLRDEGLDEKRTSRLGERRNLTILLDFEVFDSRSPDDDDDVAGNELFAVMVLDYLKVMRVFGIDRSACNQLCSAGGH